jgi:hypothetical protein
MSRITYFLSLTLAYLDQRLDFYIHPTCKHRHVKALMKLSRASGLYPECLVLKGVDIEGHPVARGGYGDVYRGLLHGKEIAVKVLRIYQDSDLVKLLKVAVPNSLFDSSHRSLIIRDSHRKQSYGDSYLILTYCLSTVFTI